MGGNGGEKWTAKCQPLFAINRQNVLAFFFAEMQARLTCPINHAIEMIDAALKPLIAEGGLAYARGT